MNFQSVVSDLLNNYQRNKSYVLDSLRAEAIVESLKDWSELGDIDTVKDWFLIQQINCSMIVENIPLLECDGWSYNRKDGIYGHRSGKFFFLQGVRVKNTNNREVVGGWDQPILTQVGLDGGILGLLRMRINEIPYYLVEAKSEPGNPDKVQICPTLQATFSNLEQAHGGKKPRFSDCFENTMAIPGCKILFEQWMSEDGGRLNLKRNKGMIVEVEQLPEGIELPDSFRWVSLFQIKQLIKENSWVSPHIRGIISHL